MKSTHNDLSSPGIGNCKDGKSEGGGRTSPFGSIAEPMSQSITPGKGKLSAQYTSINIPNPTEDSHIYSTCGTGNALPPQTAAVLKPWHIELMLLRSQKQTSTRELLSNSTAAVSHCILIYLHCTFGWEVEDFPPSFACLGVNPQKHFSLKLSTSAERSLPPHNPPMVNCLLDHAAVEPARQTDSVQYPCPPTDCRQ